MKALFLVLLASCAPPPKPVPTVSPYAAAVDVSCFMFAAARAQDEVRANAIKAQCETVLNSIYGGK